MACVVNHLGFTRLRVPAPDLSPSSFGYGRTQSAATLISFPVTASGMPLFSLVLERRLGLSAGFTYATIVYMCRSDLSRRL